MLRLHSRFLQLLLLTMVGSATCARADDRFPPYDNTEEVKAFWKSKPDFFQWKTPADLPPNLKWVNNADLPEFGDPEARKGGTLHLDVSSYPPTFRIIGPDANNSFRSEHHDNVYAWIVTRHPNEDAWVPGMADEWAISEDKKTIYFKLDPKVTFSDGTPIEVEDFFMTFYIMLSPYIKDPWYNDYFSREFSAITKYDDRTFSFTIPSPKPDPMWYVGDFQPMSRKFYIEFGPDFPARYQWRKAPSTGAYDIGPDGINQSRSVTLHRVKDWWAKDKKNFRYRFNPDFIEFKVIANMDKGYEMFRQGKLDFFYSSTPRYWYDKSEIPEIYNGYIERHVFYNEFPRVSRGIYLNQRMPLLDNQDIRLGINYALNFKQVIDVDLRGDAVRMQSTFAGFGKYTSPELRARPFDVGKAQEHFTKAGFSKRGPDGVLVNGEGKRLSLTLTCPNSGPFVPIALRLKENALKAGLELKVEGLDMVQLFKKMDQKNHEMAFAGWAAQPPYPRFWEYYHSDNAWKVQPDGTKKIVPDTNNVTMTADPALDPLIMQQREAQTEEEVQRISWHLEKLIEDRACAIPAWESPFYRYSCWRWLRFPKDGNVKASQMPLDSFVFWIDEGMKEETKKAMREGHSYGEIMRTFDKYRKN
ncbi:microcin C transport system substrate-binding protein [Roseimicrobium gellanilyticum]|uniref:Microcin C transport system substrate-binding protein n=1 Tax=Roseimicrobium gellanilyticum TaxID=748857 RepID=A0A366HI53_9BACT|nr:extracellular solute-binding protein [Roseimicrobium gellanilyticum]RBP42342.1 microcin C transport system substrate-binding protein [Roseimicrobium gellanilyticum]